MKHFYYLLLIILCLSSCTPKDISYFQDRQPGTSEQAYINSLPFKVRPGDRITIEVKSRNKELTEQFNKDGNTSYGYGLSDNTTRGYVVDNNGEIDFPVLGKVKVAGMDRQEITEYFTRVLRDNKYVDDAIVSVNYTGLFVSVLGQKGGRRISIQKDKYTIWELLAECGDLDINSKRKNVLVIREEDGIRSQYQLDLTNMKNVYESPAYYIHQNDIVYIEPNDKIKRGSTVNGNLFQTWGFWTGLTGLGMTIYNIINLFIK